MTWFRRSAHLEEELSAYADGELNERARRAVEKHLANCEACSTLLSELQDTKALLSELPKVEPRRSLALGSEHLVERRAAPAPRRASFAFAPAVALTVLVALLFVDAIDSTGGSDDDSAGITAASRNVEQQESAAGLADGAAPAGGEGGGSPGCGRFCRAPGRRRIRRCRRLHPLRATTGRSETTGGAAAQPAEEPTPQSEQAFAPLESQTPGGDDEALSEAEKAATEPTTGWPGGSEPGVGCERLFRWPLNAPHSGDPGRAGVRGVSFDRGLASDNGKTGKVTKT